ncbi:MAG TPA: hypothetical protein VF914_19240 [Chloroflexia bacterium]|jgi:hypothetical protein
MEAPEDSLIRVYSRTLWGETLVGWVDSGGFTYRARWLRRGKLLRWSVSNGGRVYIWFGSSRSLAGWVLEDGNVYDRYLLNYDHERINRPGLSGHVTRVGKVYRLGLITHKLVGRVEGTEEIDVIGGLALLLVLRR